LNKSINKEKMGVITVHYVRKNTLYFMSVFVIQNVNRINSIFEPIMGQFLLLLLLLLLF